MVSDSSRSRRPDTGPVPYTTRVLLGYALSLSVLIVLCQVSFSSSPDTNYWGLPAHSSHILLPEIQESSPDEQGTDASTESPDPSEDDDLPPPTQHDAPPSRMASAGSDAGTSSGDTDDSPASRALKNLESLTSLTQLNAPELIGGTGAYYLQIKYPKAAREQGIQGRLMLHFDVNRSGLATDIQVTDPLHPLLDSAAVRALRLVRFRPATQNGAPVTTPMRLPVRFRLVSDTVRTQTADSDLPSPPPSSGGP